MKLAVSCIALLALAAGNLPAFADTSKKLRSKSASKVVFVWNSESAQDEGIRLIQAGADLSMVAPLIACVAPNGSTIAITDFGFLSSDIVIIDGPQAGCRGNVAMDYVTTG